MTSPQNPGNPDELITGLQQARQRFLDLVAHVRPELHRYAARMTGSVADGEDVVQETLARAYYALSELATIPPLRPWLFRIVHNRALDHLRRGASRPELLLAEPPEEFPSDEPALEDTLSQQQSLQTAVSRFVALPPRQRSTVILKDVLDHSLEEIADLLEMSVPAVKAALHRGRACLAEQHASANGSALPASQDTRAEFSPALLKYTALFNARDWDGVRALLADDVRLELVSRIQKKGRRDVGAYVDNYARMTGWRFVPAWLDGREVLAAFRKDGDIDPGYLVQIDFDGDKVLLIKDFYYVSYIATEAEFVM